MSIRRAGTYSIVARDPKTHHMGVAVQSHWFSVGSAVPWAEAGVGAVATQSLVEVSYGPLGLALMRAGKSAPETLKALLATDKSRAVRQVAMIDNAGKLAVHTGSRCIPEAGHLKGKNYSVQANLMLNKKIWPAMAGAYESAKGDLPERMFSALEAAQKAGGDIRGKQSAAIKIVQGKPSRGDWRGVVMDLRVEDDPEPLMELRRLMRIHEAYRHMNDGDKAMEKDDLAGALREYATAERLYPEHPEMKFWHAVSLVNAKHTEKALPLFRSLFRQGQNWAKLIPSLKQVNLLHVDSATMRKILAENRRN